MRQQSPRAYRRGCAGGAGPAATVALVAALLAGCGPSGSGSDAPPLGAGSPGAGAQAGAPTATPAPPSPRPAIACTSTVAASAAPGSQVQHLGTVQVGETVSFQVPPGTVSVTIVEQAESAPQTITYRPPGSQAFTLDNTAVPLSVKDARGATLFDDTVTPTSDPGGPASLTAFFASNSPGTGTLTIPNTSAALALVGQAGLAAGSWSVTVSDYAYECTFPQSGGASCSGGSATSTYDVTVITKTTADGAIPATGNVDVAVYFAATTADAPAGSAALPLSAATANAGGDPDLERMGRTLRTLLARAGVTVSALTYHDLPPDLLAAYATGVDVDETGTCSALSALLRNAAAGNRLNIFFVSTFTSALNQGVSQVVGIDGTIPGPSTIGGTGASGAAVALHDLRFGRSACAGPSLSLRCGADVTAYIIAHEAGHFLGLYHVTEAEGTSFDPLQDTPACPCQTCAPVASQPSCAGATPTPSPYRMTVADCTQDTSCGGGGNLMFWLLEQGSAGTLTPEQQRVMRANPLVQ